MFITIIHTINTALSKTLKDSLQWQFRAKKPINEKSVIKTFKHTWPPPTVFARLKARCEGCLRGLPALTCSLGPWYCHNLVVVHIHEIDESAGQVANERVLHKDTVWYWVPGVVPSTDQGTDVI